MYDNNLRPGTPVVVERHARTKNDNGRPIKFSFAWFKEYVTEEDAKQIMRDKGYDEDNLCEVVSAVNFSNYDKRKKQKTVMGNPLDLDFSAIDLNYLLQDRIEEYGSKASALNEYKRERMILKNYIQEADDKGLIVTEETCALKIYDIAIRALEAEIAA